MSGHLLESQSQSAISSHRESTTLRSIIERLDPEVTAPPDHFHHKPVQQESVEIRKTPFGVIRIPSGSKEKKEKTNLRVPSLNSSIKPHPAFYDQAYIASIVGCSANGSIKQRTKHGRAELHSDGTVTFNHTKSNYTLTIVSRGSMVSLHHSESDYPISDSEIVTRLYSLAASWFMRFRRKITLNRSFLSLPSSSIHSFHHALCQIQANGPQPDFEYHLRCWSYEVTAFTQDIYVRVSRERKRVVISTHLSYKQLDKPSKNSPWIWKFATIPIATLQDESEKWIIDESKISHRSESLSSSEIEAIFHALLLTKKVDKMYSLITHD